MLITAHLKNRAKRNQTPQNPPLALPAIRRQQTVSPISKQFNCSRTTVYTQQDTTLDAANKAFEKKDEEVLFYIPVTKSFMEQSVV